MTYFDLGTDGLMERQDLSTQHDPWRGEAPARTARLRESVPVLPNLGLWAESLELPGLDCSARGRD